MGEDSLRLVAVHVDHGLRDDSSQDAEFCAEFCAARGIEYIGEKIDVRRLARSTGLGLEAAGRRARYDCFERHRRDRACARVATAHHLDDHLETLLLWWGRGSGLSAVVGIEASTAQLLRPLRAFRRKDLRDYLRWRGLEWREDPTNADSRRLRSRLRHEVLPLIESVFGPGSARRMARFSVRAAQERQALRELSQRLLDECARPGPDGEILLSRGAFAELGPLLQLQVLREVASSLALPDHSQRWNEEHFRRLLRFLQRARTGQDATLPEGLQLAVEREDFHFRPRSTPDRGELRRWILHEEVLPASAEQVTFLQHGGADLGGSTTIFHADFDADCIHGPLRLRSLQEGDRMRPLGMSGHKKIRKLLAEQAVPRHRRGEQLVVEDSRRVIWALGLATSHDARIQMSTRSVLRLRVEPELSIAKQQGKDPGS